MENQFYKSFRFWVKAALLCFCLVNFVGLPQVKGQDVLWGVNSEGGPLGGGVVYSINSDWNNHNVHKTFYNDLRNFSGEFLDIGDGFLYGTARYGGLGAGGIYRLRPDGSGFEFLHYFQRGREGGVGPGEGLIDGEDGYLYGITIPGDFESDQWIFKIRPDGSDYQIIRYFSSEFAFGKIIGKDDFLYGVSQNGIFKLSKTGQDLQFVESEFGTGRLFLDKDNNILSLRIHPNETVLTEINPEENTVHFLHRYSTGFDFSEVGIPLAGEDGSIYVLARQGRNSPGGIYKFHRDGSDYTVLHTFASTVIPVGPLVEIDGQLYGDFTDGDKQVIFSISNDGSGYSHLAEFPTRTDFVPFRTSGGLTAGPDGNIYGIRFTYNEESAETRPFWWEVVFKISPDGSEFSTLWNAINPEGYLPRELIQGGDGNFYGITGRGGDFGRGTFFTIGADGKSFQVIFSLKEAMVDIFNGTDGNIYGTSVRTSNRRFLYRLDPIGKEKILLRNFNQAIGELFQGPDDNFYGIISPGNIFKLGPDGSGFSIIWQPDAGEPQSQHRIFPGNDEYMFGIYSQNIHSPTESYSISRIFRVKYDGSSFQFLHSFDREVPNSLFIGSDGYIYGAISTSIFRMSPEGGDLTHFPVDPDFSLTILEETDGYFYGTRGTNGIFKIAVDGSDFSEFQGSRNAPVGLFVLQKSTCPLPSLNPPLLSEDNITPGSELTAHVPLPEDHSWISAVWHWGDGETSVATFNDSTATGSHVYEKAGSYTVRLEVTDDCGTRTSPPSETITVTDEAQPSTGSVKGSGMFSSPMGAYTDKPQMKGMAHYSISAKADNGKVSGTFQFKIADLQFRSSKYDQLIIEDNRAWLYGEGKIRGRGKYGFLLAMVDEEDNRNEKSYRKWKTRGKDKLRVKIWNISKDNRLVYDNQLGDSDDAVAVMNIDRGTIIILEEESSPVNELDNDFILEQLKKIKAYPNPVQDRMTVDLGSLSPETINTIVTDAYGKLELHNIHQVSGNQLEFDLSALKHGFYYIQIRTEQGYRSIKLLKR